MKRHMKTIDQPESNHGQSNTIVGFRITEDEQRKLKSIPKDHENPRYQRNNFRCLEDDPAHL
jgi:hypothetical protein